MTIDIPDEWIKRLLNAHPSMTAKDALKVHFRDRGEISNRLLIVALGDYTLHQLGLQINEKP